MKKKRYRIGTVLTRTYSKTKRNAKKSATMRAVTNTSARIKKRFITLFNKTKKTMKQTTAKVDQTIAKKIRSITKRRR